MFNIIQREPTRYEIALNSSKFKATNENTSRTFYTTAYVGEREVVAKPLRSTKQKSRRDTVQYFIDIKQVRD